MRITKYLCFCFLVICTCVLSGECYLMHHSHLGTMGYEILLREPTEAELAELLAYHGQGGVHCYIEESGVYYCDETTKEALRESCQLVEGTVASLFYGSVTVSFRPLEDYEWKAAQRLYVGIYCPDKGSRTLAELYQKYGFCSEGTPVYFGESGAKVFLFSLLAAGLMLLLSYYECLLSGKQILVSVMLGHRMRDLILRRIFADTAGYLLAAALICGIMSRITYIGFVRKATLGVLLGFLLGNSLLQCIFLRLKTKQVLGSVVSDQRNLRLNRFLYVCVLVGAVFLFRAGLRELREYRAQERDYAFWESKQDALTVRQIDVWEHPEIMDRQYQALLYAEISKEHEVLELAYGGNYAGDASEEERQVKLNRAAAAYLGEWIGALADVSFDQSYYVIVPEGEEITEERMELWKRELYDGCTYREEPCVLTYSGNCRVPAIESGGIFHTVKQPILLLTMYEEPIMDAQSAPFGYIRLDCCLLDLTEAELSVYAAAHGLEIRAVSPWKLISEQAAKNRLLLQSCFVTGSFFLFAIAVLLITIVRMTYLVEGKELCLKKIHGASLRSCFGELLGMVLKDSAAAFLLAVCLRHRNASDVLLALGCSAALCLASAVLVLGMGSLLMRRNAVKILKGGAL